MGGLKSPLFEYLISHDSYIFLLPKGGTVQFKQFAHGFLTVTQGFILTLQLIAFCVLMVLDYSRFQEYLIHSRLELTLFNRIFFTIFSILEPVSVKLTVISFVVLVLIILLFYFFLVKQIWRMPSKEALIFSVITLISTGLFCFFALNFWQIYSNFM